MMIKTIEEAHELIGRVKVCTVFPSDKVPYTSLWDHVDLPDKVAGESGWGQKMESVWTWKTRLPAEYPDDIFYGKIKGGLAVLMDMDFMRDVHFPAAYQPVDQLKPLARQVNEIVSTETWDTTTLRKAAIERTGCSKSQFDTALKQLQISMNVVRLNHPDAERDTWVPFRELYLEVWSRHVRDD
jgi:hypothetical protein